MHWSINRLLPTVENCIFAALIVVSFVFFYHQTALANPYGFDTYGTGVYGSETMLTIATTGNVSIASQSGALSTNLASPTTVTVTTTDKHGFNLYIRSITSTSLTSGGNTIPASSNNSALALANNTWGYTTNGGDLNSFIGITASDVSIKSASSGPYYPTGDTTDVYYGVKINDATAAGNYSSGVVFTAVAQSP